MTDADDSDAPAFTASQSADVALGRVRETVRRANRPPLRSLTRVRRPPTRLGSVGVGPPSSAAATQLAHETTHSHASTGARR